MNFNIKDDERYYLEKIKQNLVMKYSLDNVMALKKLEEYDYLSEIIECDIEYFYYQSPEYWADYLMS